MRNQNGSISELSLLTDEDRRIRAWERLEDWHTTFECGYRFDLALQDKWMLAMVEQGGTI